MYSPRTPRNPVSIYLAVAAAVWIGILSATSIDLKGTPYMVQVLPILLGGAVIFVVIIPMGLFRPPTTPRR